jgi:hypothetical protein
MNLTVTGTSAVGQIVTNSGADLLAQPVEGQHGSASVSATPTKNAPKFEAAAPAAFGLVLHYDQDMQRLILEARDSASGFVIFQIPQKYVTEQFATLPANGARVRGTSVDRAV